MMFYMLSFFCCFFAALAGASYAETNRQITEDAFWQKTIEAAAVTKNAKPYRIYLTACPNGKYAKTAKDKIDDYEWARLQKKDFVTLYEKFVQEYPDSKYIKQAQKHIKAKINIECKKSQKVHILAYQMVYELNFAPAVRKLQTTSDPFLLRIAKNEFKAAKTSMLEVGRLWEACYAKKGSAANKKTYGEIKDKVESALFMWDEE